MQPISVIVYCVISLDYKNLVSIVNVFSESNFERCVATEAATLTVDITTVIIMVITTMDIITGEDAAAMVTATDTIAARLSAKYVSSDVVSQINIWEL